MDRRQVGEVSAIHGALKEVFGFDQLRAGQEEVISRIVGGRSALAVFPTGSGKSLCYQLPAVMLNGLTIVVSPLIALMKDQVESLLARGVVARRLDSSLSTEEARAVYDEMYHGRVKILFVAPERFANPTFINRLKKLNIALLAIDEAHCISEWGHAFRPDYLKIARAANELEIRLKLALTATATPRVSADICKSFGIEEGDHIQTGFKRPNLTLNVQTVEADQRDGLLLEMLRQHPGEATIIYVTRQMTTEHVTTYLRRSAGLRVRSYHAGMSVEKRDEIQEEFMSGRCDIIVATIAFGMGIDKADIRNVYHYNLPKSFENYVQETGRAGRDGMPSQCYLLACKDDLSTLENFVYAKRPSVHAIESLVSACIESREEVALDRYNLSVAHDIKTEVIQTILVWLELEGYIQSRGWRHGKYQATMLRPFYQILEGHTEARKEFLERLFNAGKVSPRKQTSVGFDISEVSYKINEPGSKIAQALQWLETHGDLALKPSQYLMLYQATERGVEASRKEVTQMVEQHFAHWERQEIGRLQYIISLIESPNCLEQQVLGYFGETSAPCGKCSSCRGQGGQKMKDAEHITFTEADMQIIRGLMEENHVSLRAPRQMARFLCGMTSPATTRERLTTKHDQFAVFEEYRFEDVLLNCQVVMGAV